MITLWSLWSQRSVIRTQAMQGAEILVSLLCVPEFQVSGVEHVPAWRQVITSFRG